MVLLARHKRIKAYPTQKPNKKTNKEPVSKTVTKRIYRILMRNLTSHAAEITTLEGTQAIDYPKQENTKIMWFHLTVYVDGQRGGFY